MKLHLPKSLLVAVLAACVGGKLQAAEAFTAVDFTGSFYPYSYTFSFILNDVGNNGNVVGAYWGNSGANDEYGANALTITRNDDDSYTVNLGRGQLGNTNIDATTTFTPKTEAYDSMTFEGTLKAGVVYTIVGSDDRSSDDYHASATITDSHGTTIAPKEGDSTYKNNMNGSGATNTGVNSKYAVDAGDAILWHSTTSESMATDSDNWKTVTNEGISGITNSSALYFEAVDALSKNVDVTGLGEVGRIYVADNYSFTTSSPTTINATDGITIYSGKTLTLNSTATESNKLTSDISGGILSISTGSWTAENAVISSAVEVADDSTLTIGDGSILKASNFVSINGMTNVVTSGTGYVQLTLERNELSLDNSLTATKEYRVHDNFDINGKGYNSDCPAEGRSLTFNEGTGIIVDGIFSIVTRAVVNIAGGSVEAGSIKLGHGTESGTDAKPYWGKIAMSSGSLKTGTITMQTDKQNVVSITGGELEFTTEAAINRGSNTASTVSIKGAGSSDTERVTLKATSVDWTLDGAGLTSKPVIGNVTIDAGNTHSITFANVALSGSVVSNAELALGSGITVVAGNSATLATGGDGVIVLGDTIQNSGSIELGGTLKLAGVPSDFAEKSVGSKSYVLDANKPAVTNDGQNGFVLTSAAQYWVVQGANSPLASENMTIGDAYNNTYNLTAAENGIYLTTGDNYVATDKYYITTGDVTVVGTGAENATGADSYILQGGTMQLTGGTVKTSEIVYSSGNVHLHKEATIVLDNLEKLATNTDSGAYTNVFDGTMYSGSGTLEFQLHGNNGRGLDLSNFEGSIVVSKASGETYGRLQVNSSILHENATITLSDGGELVFNSDNVTLSNALTVKGNSQLHVNSTHKATITSAIDGGGTLIKVGNDSTLNLNGNISVGLFQTNGGTTNVIGGSVTNLKANGGTTNIQAGTLTNLSIAGGTTNIQAGTLTNLSIAGGTTYVTGGKITDIAYTNNGTVNFNLAQGVESSKLSVDNIILTTANDTDYYNRHINVASGVTLTVGEIKNQWGMGTIDVDGALTAETITMTSGGDGEDKNVITGDGQITTDSLVITNAGNYRVSAATLTINNELKQDNATISQYGGTINVEGSLNSSGGNINQHGGTINVNGLLNNTGATMNLFGGQMNVNNTEGINKIYKLDMAGDNDRNSKLNLAAGSALEVSSNFWLGGTSVITLNEGATLSKDGMTITGKGTSSTITRLTAGDSNDFYASSDDHEIKNSAVSITKESENGNTLALKLTNSSVANDSTSRLVVSNTANTLTGVYANKGVLALTGLAELQLQDLVVKSGATLSVGANNNGVVMVGSPTAVASTTGSSPRATLEGGATIQGSLNLSNASSLTLDGIGENSLVNITGYLILPGASETPTLTLSGDILSSLNAMNQGDTLGIFSVHGGFFVGGTEYADIQDATDGIALNTVFSANANINFEGYYLGIIPDEGYSTVYIGKIVPEPTTATLSLLALAALAARRRRASR